VIRRSALAVSLLLSPLLAQTKAVQERIERALGHLLEPERTAEAAGELEHLGRLAVPSLRQALIDAREPGPRRALVEVLGRIGEPALPALPELRALLGDQDAALANAALWATLQVGVHLRDGREAVAEDVHRLRGQLDRLQPQWLYGVGRLSLSWPPQVPADVLIAALADDSMHAVVAAAMAVAGERFAPADRELLRAAAATAWTKWTDNLPADTTTDEAEVVHTYLAAAARRLDRSPDRAMNLALLQHLDPRERADAVQRLGGDDGLAPDGRCLLVHMLGDDDGAVRAAALHAVRGFGAAALPYLGLLAAGARPEADSPSAEVCRQALAQLLAVLKQHSEDPRAREVIQDVALLLRYETPASRGPASAAATRQLAAMIAGLADGEGRQLEMVLGYARQRACHSPEMVDAVARLLSFPSGPVWEAAVALLADQGRLAVDKVGAGGRALLHLVQGEDAPGSVRDLHELAAWVFAGPDASTAELRALLAGDDPRVLLRAVCELAFRSDAVWANLATGLAAVQGLGQVPRWAEDLRPLEQRLWLDARAAAALLTLARAGTALPAPLREHIGDRLRLTDEDLGHRLADLGSDGGRALLRLLEDAAVRDLRPALSLRRR